MGSVLLSQALFLVAYVAANYVLVVALHGGIYGHIWSRNLMEMPHAALYGLLLALLPSVRSNKYFQVRAENTSLPACLREMVVSPESRAAAANRYALFPSRACDQITSACVRGWAELAAPFALNTLQTGGYMFVCEAAVLLAGALSDVALGAQFVLTRLTLLNFAALIGVYVVAADLFARSLVWGTLHHIHCTAAAILLVHTAFGLVIALGAHFSSVLLAICPGLGESHD